jgi:hypothetical protein
MQYDDQEDPWAWVEQQQSAQQGVPRRLETQQQPDMQPGPPQEPGLIGGTVMPMVANKLLAPAQTAMSGVVDAAVAPLSKAVGVPAAAGAAAAPAAATGLAGLAAPLTAMGPLGWAGLAFMAGKKFKLF